MQRIPVPNIAYSDIEVTLDNVRYLFSYRYNVRNGRWKLDIKDIDDEYIVKGLTLIEQESPTVSLISIDFPDGMISVVRLQKDGLNATRQNTGIGKSYELIYTSFSELT